MTFVARKTGVVLTSFWLLSFILVVSTAWAQSKGRKSEKITIKAVDSRVNTDFELQQGEWMELEVRGKWRMWDKWDYTDEFGHTHFKKINKLGLLGCLILQVGDAQPIALTDRNPFQAPGSGKLFLGANREGFTNLAADGELTVTIHINEALKEKKLKALAAVKEANDKLLADPEITRTGACQQL
jgi:hypothetical protein